MDMGLDMDRFVMRKMEGRGDMGGGLQPPHGECGTPVAKLRTWQEARTATSGALGIMVAAMKVP